MVQQMGTMPPLGFVKELRVETTAHGGFLWHLRPYMMPMGMRPYMICVLPRSTLDSACRWGPSKGSGVSRPGEA